jgi:transcriptional regulator with XRE-family HTH domain
MSVADHLSGRRAAPERNLTAPPRALHRLGAVRRLQGVSRRSVARKLDTDVAKVKIEERPTADLLLSRLYEWQEALEVPVTELLVEAGDELAMPVLKRAQLVRMMKTVLGILDASREEPIRRMAQTLIDQFLDVMPELRGISPWHAVGRRRRRDEYGVAALRRISEDVFIDLMDF